MSDSSRQAQAWLDAALGFGASFREGQLEAIEALVDRRERVLVVQATGWGKSVVYFIATRLLRDRDAGPTVLISPLLSLMRDQIRMAERLGVRACSLTSENSDEWPAIKQALSENACDILLVSPERLGNEEFQREVVPLFRPGIGLLVVDEAHCISDWGHDFRPDYRRIVRVVQQLPAGVPVLATTATANDRVVHDVEHQLGPDLEVHRGPLARKSLRLQSIVLADQAERLAWLTHHLTELPGSGIVYCLTVADCARVAAWLQRNGVDANAYFADLSTEQKEEFEQRLLSNQVKALVSTVALGMGFDKPDLGFVVHFQRPGSLVAYYQQIGRAGRAVDDAVAILLNGREDDEIHDYFISTAFPGAETLRSVLGVIEQTPGIRIRGIERRIDVKHMKLQQALKFLEIDQAIYREDGAFYRTPTAWSPDLPTWDAVTARRKQELAEIKAFALSGDCLMELVTRALDDPHAERCGRCANCAGEIVSEELDQAAVVRAIDFLRRSYLPISPRRQWPAGVGGSARLPAEERAEEGRALSIWGDAGWGAAVREAKYGAGHFGDELVTAMAEMIQSWKPRPQPAWVTCVPSLRHPELVADFARRLATRIGIPFDPALIKTRMALPQKLQENSAHQAANVRGTFDVKTPLRYRGSVLLVDDVVDSRWTLTECARVLRLAGVPAVFPVALAEAGPAWRSSE